MQWQTVQSNSHIQYQKKLGGFRPHFQGKPEGYYELSAWDICSALSVCTFIIAAMFFICVGFFFWSDNISTFHLVLVWSIILCVFIPFFMIVAYCNSRGKMEIQERLVKQALEKQLKQKEAREKFREQNSAIEMKNLKKVDLEKSTEQLLRASP